MFLESLWSVTQIVLGNLQYQHPPEYVQKSEASEVVVIWTVFFLIWVCYVRALQF